MGLLTFVNDSPELNLEAIDTFLWGRMMETVNYLEAHDDLLIAVAVDGGLSLVWMMMDETSSRKAVGVIVHVHESTNTVARARKIQNA